MASFLARIFGWPGAARPPASPVPARTRRPVSASRPFTSRGGNSYARPGFIYSDSTTWEFPHRAVASTNIASVAYDGGGEVLEIRFTEASRNHSALYRYSEVPCWVYHGLMETASKGEYHWRIIRDKYTYADVG